METLSQPLTTDPAEYRQQMMKRLDTLRRNERFGDVTVVVQGKEFTAHKLVLSAASPFFLKLLESNMKESREDRIKVTLAETTTSVMEDVLEYIYTGNVTVTEKSSLHNLIATADYLQILSLKTLSERLLQQNLAIENCISTYLFAEKYHCEELMAKSLQFINSNFMLVMATEGFLSLNSKQVTELISSDDIIVNTEEEVFKAILNWVSQNRSEREGEFAGLFCQIRLISVSRDYLFNEMVKEELVTQNNECLKVVLDAMKWSGNATEEDVPQPPRKCMETHTDAILACNGHKALYYLPEQKIWYQLPGSVNFEGHVVTQYGDKVYIAGAEEFAVSECHLSLFKTCTAPPGGPDEIDFSSVTVLKGYLYASCSVTDPVAMVYKYYPNEGLWETLTDPPTRRWGACGVSDGKHLYLMGGAAVETWHAAATTERFDPDENRWEEVAGMNQARRDAFGAATNNKIYVAGGISTYFADEFAIVSCEVYNTVTNDWQFIASLQVPREYGSMVCYQGALYVLGGSNEEESNELSVEVYDPDRNEWRKETDIPTSSQRLGGFKACVARFSKDVIDHLQPEGYFVQLP